ncbi:MAG TPA: peroxiredoxin [Gemmatimonadaceae bacterium]|jgi:peroxiredoxin (alkyl hydroperoxide reductase subunit C)
MSRLLGLGARFPDFSLPACVSAEAGSEFRTVSSQEMEGTWTAIFFWPQDFTFVCPTELMEFNYALREFRALAAKVFGVSGDTHHSHLAWRNENPDVRNIAFPMLADADKRVAEELGILDPIDKVPLRATYLLDKDRKIRWLCVNDLSVGRSTGEVLRVLAALQCGELCPANWKPGQPTLVPPRGKRKSARWEIKEPVASA